MGDSVTARGKAQRVTRSISGRMGAVEPPSVGDRIPNPEAVISVADRVTGSKGQRSGGVSGFRVTGVLRAVAISYATVRSGKVVNFSMPVSRLSGRD